MIAVPQPSRRTLKDAPTLYQRLSMRWLQPALLMMAAFGATAVGCGYHLAGSVIGLPEDVRSISVGTIENHSSEHGLEQHLAFALEREVFVRRQLQMEANPASGDAVLSGRIRSVQVRPVAYNNDDQAVQYEIVLGVDLTLTRQHDGQVLWQVKDLRESGEYSTSAGVVVTSSSQFQRETLDPADIQDRQLSPKFADNPESTSIQLGETERQYALARLLKQAARDIYNQMVENF